MGKSFGSIKVDNYQYTCISSIEWRKLLWCQFQRMLDLRLHNQIKYKFRKKSKNFDFQICWSSEVIQVRGVMAFSCSILSHLFIGALVPRVLSVFCVCEWKFLVCKAPELFQTGLWSVLHIRCLLRAWWTYVWFVYTQSVDIYLSKR